MFRVYLKIDQDPPLAKFSENFSKNFDPPKCHKTSKFGSKTPKSRFFKIGAVPPPLIKNFQKFVFSATRYPKTSHLPLVRSKMINCVRVCAVCKIAELRIGGPGGDPPGVPRDPYTTSLYKLREYILKRIR